MGIDMPALHFDFFWVVGTTSTHCLSTDCISLDIKRLHTSNNIRNMNRTGPTYHGQGWPHPLQHTGMFCLATWVMWYNSMRVISKWWQQHS
jgi:hypothetical protein